MKPLFLISLPRSGSTLLQRMLVAGGSISTTPEPWLLLPLLYSLREGGSQSEYGHWTLVEAIEDFCGALPGGRREYLRQVGRFAGDLYRSAAQEDAVYFLDKTPRYHLVIDEIAEVFPDARFILLRRNPLAVAASMMQTWGAGKWNLHHFQVDLYTGLENLVQAQERLAGRLVLVNFEDLVQDPQNQCERLCSELGIPVSDNMWRSFADQQLGGRMGDPTGSQLYDSVSAGAADKWKETYCNPLRRAWARGYLDWIGRERLSQLGYESDSLRADLSDAKGLLRFAPTDSVRMPYGVLREKVWRWFLGRRWP